jgi:hypothetical protein
VFKLKRYDLADGYLFTSMKNLRQKITQKVPNLAKSPELSYMLLPTGRVGLANKAL